MIILFHSVFFPLMVTLHAFVESSHGLICRPNLDLHEVGSSGSTYRYWTLSIHLIHILPGLLASQNIIHFFPFEWHLVFELLFQDKHVRAGSAEKSEVCHRLLYEQEVCTSWAKQHYYYWFLYVNKFEVLALFVPVSAIFIDLCK